MTNETTGIKDDTVHHACAEHQTVDGGATREIRCVSATTLGRVLFVRSRHSSFLLCEVEVFGSSKYSCVLVIVAPAGKVIMVLFFQNATRHEEYIYTDGTQRKQCSVVDCLIYLNIFLLCCCFIYGSW